VVPVIDKLQQTKEAKMPQAPNRSAKILAAAMLVIGGLSLTACATKEYVREQVEIVNTRVTTVDAKATDAVQRADAAASAAQSAASAAQAAAADARTANQRLDQLTTRVDAVEQRSTTRRPRN
jgi:hypothetical protein